MERRTGIRQSTITRICRQEAKTAGKIWLLSAGEQVNWKTGGPDLSTLLAGNNYESGLMIRKKTNPKKGVQVLHVRRTWTPFLFARLVSSRKTS